LLKFAEKRRRQFYWRSAAAAAIAESIFVVGCNSPSATLRTEATAKVGNRARLVAPADEKMRRLIANPNKAKA
jgi:hypothetical protein